MPTPDCPHPHYPAPPSSPRQQQLPLSTTPALPARPTSPQPRPAPPQFNARRPNSGVFLSHLWINQAQQNHRRDSLLRHRWDFNSDSLPARGRPAVHQKAAEAGFLQPGGGTSPHLPQPSLAPPFPAPTRPPTLLAPSLLAEPSASPPAARPPPCSATPTPPHSAPPTLFSASLRQYWDQSIFLITPLKKFNAWKIKIKIAAGTRRCSADWSYRLQDW